MSAKRKILLLLFQVALKRQQAAEDAIALGLATVATGKQFGYLPQGPIFGFEITDPKNGLDAEETATLKKENTMKPEAIHPEGISSSSRLALDQASARKDDGNEDRNGETNIIVVNLSSETSAVKTNEAIECNTDEKNPGSFPKRMKNVILKRTELLENSLDMLTKLFPNKKRSVLELVLKRCGDDLIKAIEEIVPKSVGQYENREETPEQKEMDQTSKQKSDPKTNGNLLFLHEGQSSAFKPVAAKPPLEESTFPKYRKPDGRQQNTGKCPVTERVQRTGVFGQVGASPNAHPASRHFPPLGDMEMLRPNGFPLPFTQSNVNFPLAHNSISTALFALGGPGFNFGCSLNGFPNFSITGSQNLSAFPGMSHVAMLSNLTGQSTGALCSNDFLLQMPGDHLKVRGDFCRGNCELAPVDDGVRAVGVRTEKDD